MRATRCTQKHRSACEFAAAEVAKQFLLCDGKAIVPDDGEPERAPTCTRFNGVPKHLTFFLLSPRFQHSPLNGTLWHQADSRSHCCLTVTPCGLILDLPQRVKRRLLQAPIEGPAGLFFPLPFFLPRFVGSCAPAQAETRGCRTAMDHQNGTLALQTGAAQLVSMSIQGGPPYVSLPPPQAVVVPAVPGQLQELPGQGAVQLPPAALGPAVPGSKHCGGCGNVKSSDDFHKSKSRGDGLQVWSASCPIPGLALHPHACRERRGSSCLHELCVLPAEPLQGVHGATAHQLAQEAPRGAGAGRGEQGVRRLQQGEARVRVLRGPQAQGRPAVPVQDLHVPAPRALAGQEARGSR